MDTTAGRPVVVWRELDRTMRVRDLARTPTSLSALVEIPPVYYFEEMILQLWRWELPAITLRGRPSLELSGAEQGALLANGQLITAVRQEGEDHVALQWQDGLVNSQPAHSVST